MKFKFFQTAADDEPQVQPVQSRPRPPNITIVPGDLPEPTNEQFAKFLVNLTDNNDKWVKSLHVWMLLGALAEIYGIEHVNFETLLEFLEHFSNNSILQLEGYLRLLDGRENEEPLFYRDTVFAFAAEHEVM